MVLTVQWIGIVLGLEFRQQELSNSKCLSKKMCLQAKDKKYKIGWKNPVVCLLKEVHEIFRNVGDD